jgi:hypothetical protein
MITDKNDQMDELLDESDDPAEGPYAEDDWGSYDDPDSAALLAEEEPVERSRGKKPGMTGKLLIGAVILVGGIVAFLQMGPHSQPSTPIPEPEMTAQQTWSATPPADTGSPAPPMPATIEQAEPPAPESQPQEVADSSEAQAVRMPKAADILLKSSVNDTPAPASAAGSEEIAQLSAKIDQLMARLDKMEGNVATIEALKDSVQILERKVAALSPSGPVISKRLSPGMAEKPSPAVAPPAPAATAAAPAPAPTILGKSPVESAAESEADAAVIPAPAAPAEEESGPAWVLKGAQPGRAMVSRPGESDMRTVEVGSVLAGIGQVTDISYQDGRWVVTGTRGRITQ